MLRSGGERTGSENGPVPGTMMKQPISFHPLLIGSGRLSAHLHEYFTLTGVPHEVLKDSRKLSGLETILVQASKTGPFSHFWLLVSDDALPALSRHLNDRYPEIPQIHSSAATALPGALTLHPLMSFGPSLYPLSVYETFPFVFIEDETKANPDFEALIRTTFKNRMFKIKGCDRERYHLNCSMISNLSVLLWSAAMKAGPGLEIEWFIPILEQTLKNFGTSGESALTGPLARGDQITLNRHLNTLKGLPEHGLYKAFMEYYADRS